MANFGQGVLLCRLFWTRRAEVSFARLCQLEMVVLLTDLTGR